MIKDFQQYSTAAAQLESEPGELSGAPKHGGDTFSGFWAGKRYKLGLDIEGVKPRNLAKASSKKFIPENL